MAYHNKRKQAEMQSASHPKDLGVLLNQGNIGNHGEKGDIGDLLGQSPIKAKITSEPGITINHLLGQ